MCVHVCVHVCVRVCVCVSVCALIHTHASIGLTFSFQFTYNRD